MFEIDGHETQFSAPDGTADVRRIVGVGETVALSANRSARWSGTGATGFPAGDRRQARLTFNRPGEYTITARAGTHVDTKVFRVVEPSVSVRRVVRIMTFPEEHDSSRQQVGVGMRLQFTLTPLNVSFKGIQFREESGAADQVWGYFRKFFATRPALSRHHAVAKWVGVEPNNDLSVQDTAQFAMRPRHMDWPFAAGGFRWRIQDSYRVGSLERQLPRRMPQSLRIDPAGQRSGAFTGTLSINKGGVTTTSHYVNNRLVSVN